MKARIGEIIKFPWKYQMCRNCGTMNSIQNKRCWECRSREFRDLTIREVGELKEDYKGSEEEISV